MQVINTLEHNLNVFLGYDFPHYKITHRLKLAVYKTPDGIKHLATIRYEDYSKNKRWERKSSLKKVVKYIEERQKIWFEDNQNSYNKLRRQLTLLKGLVDQKNLKSFSNSQLVFNYLVVEKIALKINFNTAFSDDLKRYMYSTELKTKILYHQFSTNMEMYIHATKACRSLFTFDLKCLQTDCQQVHRVLVNPFELFEALYFNNMELVQSHPAQLFSEMRTKISFVNLTAKVGKIDKIIDLLGSLHKKVT